MNELVNLVIGQSFDETCVRIVILLAIFQFIGAIFGTIGRMKG